MDIEDEKDLNSKGSSGRATYLSLVGAPTDVGAYSDIGDSILQTDDQISSYE